MSDFLLTAIKCKTCGSGLVIELNDTVTYCTSCGSGFEITDGKTEPIEINFAAPAIRSEGEITYKPFWLIRSHADVYERTSSGGFISKLFGSDKTSGSLNIIFYIPAYNCSLDKMKEISEAFTSRNPVPSPQKYNVKITGFNYSKEDAKRFCEFIFISLEAEKSDVMKIFKYKLTHNSFEILGIPFYKMPDGSYKDAILGINS
jgi:hypothetical protein